MDPRSLLFALALALGTPASAGDAEQLPDDAAADEFAPPELGKGNDLFIGADIDRRVRQGLRRGLGTTGGGASGAVAIELPRGRAGPVNVNICSVVTSAPTRNIANACNVSGVSVGRSSP